MIDGFAHRIKRNKSAHTYHSWKIRDHGAELSNHPVEISLSSFWVNFGHRFGKSQFGIESEPHAKHLNVDRKHASPPEDE